MLNFPKDNYRKFVNQAFLCEGYMNDDDGDDETEGVHHIEQDRSSRQPSRRSYDRDHKSYDRYPSRGRSASYSRRDHPSRDKFPSRGG